METEVVTEGVERDTERVPSFDLHGILTEARGLVHRLGDQEKVTDTMLTTCEGLNLKINGMKQYQADLHELNLTQPGARSGVLRSLQEENKQVRQLREENHLLKSELQEHQAVLEILMQKHRETMVDVMKVQKIEELSNKVYDKFVGPEASESERISQLHEFAGVFDECLKMGEEGSHRDHEELSRLKTENRTLRQLLQIAGTNEPSVLKEFKERWKDRDTDGNGDSTPTNDAPPSMEISPSPVFNAIPSD